MFTEKSFDTSEIVVNYAEGGADGPPLVILHGITQNWQSMRPLMERLSASAHLYACDLRGHGRSGRSTAGYAVPQYVPDTAAFIERCVDQPAWLLGFSLGAIVALGVAARRSDRLRGLLLLDPPLSLRDSSVAGHEVAAWLEWIVEARAATHTQDELADRLRLNWVDDDEPEIRRGAQMLFDLDLAALPPLREDRLFEGFDLETVLPQVTCPTLMLCGEPALGSVVRDHDLDYFKARVPGSTVARIAGVGHALHREQPDLVLAHIMQFLRTP
jgi:pimeloyl-ACP methyl ester carboxylesterase